MRNPEMQSVSERPEMKRTHGLPSLTRQVSSDETPCNIARRARTKQEKTRAVTTIDFIPPLAIR
jgi:hypothetical protein